MLREIQVDEPIGLPEYESLAFLAPSVQRLRSESSPAVRALEGRRLWMVNSTEQGGGVAEMLPKMVALLRELGVDARWLVAGSDEPEFFRLTKHIHNLIHGVGRPELGPEQRELYQRVSQTLADELDQTVAPGDVLVIHDPQPLGAGALLRQRRELPCVWRCHIGLERRTPVTGAVWRFLEPWAVAYDHSVFSTADYVPDYLSSRASVIHPAIDPLSHKNRELSPHKLTGILCNSGLAVEHAPVLTPAFAHSAQRLRPDGSWASPASHDELGLPFRPMVTQVSRWDRLKGFAPLLSAFGLLKARAGQTTDERHRRRLQILRMVLAGPDPSGVTDDPEGAEVLEELRASYLALPAELRADLVLLRLPMVSRKENALMVNVLQRCSTVVVQNSMREGFGLTATEAMWKRVPVLASRTGGLRLQVRDRIDGRLVDDPDDSEGLAQVLDELLADPTSREVMGRSGQRRVVDEFLVFAQLERWLDLLCDLLEPASQPRPLA